MRLLTTLLFLSLCFRMEARTDVVCTSADSARVVELMQEVAEGQKGSEVQKVKKGSEGVKGVQKVSSGALMMRFAKALMGTPYVGKTLEVDAKGEPLVVNLREVDCTTFIEYLAAMTLTVKAGKTDFQTFCKNLTRLRYQDGHNKGYASRNHYFTWWIDSNCHQGLTREIVSDKSPFTAVQNVFINWMSVHPDSYCQLQEQPEEKPLIATHERATNGRKVRYIPKTLTGGGKTALKDIHDGDILAIITNKKGLDTSHIGLAYWQHGHLHLLHASSNHKKVVVEPVPLKQYMQKHPSQLGIRVVRLE